MQLGSDHSSNTPFRPLPLGASAADLSMLRIPPPRCVGGCLSRIRRRLFLKVCRFVFVLFRFVPRSLIGTMAPIAVELLERMACHRLFAISVCLFFWFCNVLFLYFLVKKHKIHKNVQNRLSFPTRFRNFGFRFIFGRLGVPKREGGRNEPGQF